jgi:hypothetical protein
MLAAMTRSGTSRGHVVGSCHPVRMTISNQSTKRCRKCGFNKPVSLFPRNRHSSRCKPCHAADVRQWTHAEPERLERVRRRAAEWKQHHPERHRANARKRRRERWREDPVFRQASRKVASIPTKAHSKMRNGISQLGPGQPRECESPKLKVGGTASREDA